MPKPQDYLDFSQVFIGTNGVARLGRPNPATAQMLALVDKHRDYLTGKSYEDFCTDMALLLGIKRHVSYSIEGISADWYNAYNYAHNGGCSFLVLHYLLRNRSQRITLPITMTTLEELGCDEPEYEMIRVLLSN